MRATLQPFLVKERQPEGRGVENRRSMILAHPGLAVGRQPDLEFGEVRHDGVGERFFRERIEIREGALK